MATHEHAAEDFSGDRIWGGSLGERISIYADRVGLKNDGKLADAAGELLGAYYDPIKRKRVKGMATMNRELVRALQAGKLEPGDGVNDLQLAAIAAALNVPMEWLDVDPNAPSVRFIRRLFSGPTAPTNGGNEDNITPLRQPEDESDEGGSESRWSAVPAAQAA